MFITHQHTGNMLIKEGVIISNHIWQISSSSLVKLKNRFVQDQKYISAHYIREFEKYLIESKEFEINREDFHYIDFVQFIDHLNNVKIGVN